MSNPVTSPSGAQLRAARHALGWTQRQLAKRSGIHYITVHLYERDKPQFSTAATRQKLADALRRGGITFTEDGISLPGRH